MSKPVGQFDVPTVIEAPRASVAFARALQALALYGADHAAVRQRVAEFSSACGELTSVMRLYAEPGRMVHAGAALQPGDLFAPVAELLHHSGMAIIDLRGGVQPEQALRMFGLLTNSRGDAAAREALPQAVADATGGAVRVFALTADHLRIRAAAASARPADAHHNQRGFALHELDRRVAPRCAAAKLTAADAARQIDAAAMEHFGGNAAVESVLHLCATGDAAASQVADLQSLRSAVSALSDDQRRLLLESLGCESNVSFDDASRILALMPVRDVADAIAVLERPDARMSSTTLMLLRRLAHLSLGHDVELSRLARVAEDWAVDEAELGEDAGLARSTAELLTRLNDTEFRCEEYSELLQQLSADQTDAIGLTCMLAADDLAQAPQRVVEVVCDSISCSDFDLDATASLRFLRERCGAIADLGDVDMVRRVTGIADRFLKNAKNEIESKAARSILDAVEAERWMSRAIAGMIDEHAVRDEIERLRAAGQSASDMYVAALCASKSPARFNTLAACRDLFTHAELRIAIVRGLTVEPRCVVALAPFIHRAMPSELVDLITPTLLHPAADVRRQAFVAMERLGVEWRDDLYVRGALDEDEQVRLATIRAIARSGGRHARLLIERLAGRIGSATCSSVEVKALQGALKTEYGGGVTSQIALALCMLSIWPMCLRDGSALAESLRARPRTPLSVIALLLHRLSPLQVAMRLATRRKGIRHE